MNHYEALKQIINHGQHIAVFTGAGISVPSGIPDFRSEQGLYHDHKKGVISPEKILSHSYFNEHTKDFYDFYRAKMLYPHAKPNIAHRYFASLETQGKNVKVVTQNIDGFHQEAGSSIVYELHGNVHQNHCQICHRFFDLDYILKTDGIPLCDGCGGIIKPDVILYDEPLNYDILNQVASLISHCDVLIVIGTSLSVYPAASFLHYFRGSKLVVINKRKTPYDKMCDLVIHEDIESVITMIGKPS